MLAQNLMALFGFLMRRSGQRFYVLVEELELSLTQIKTLHLLERREADLSVKQVAEQLGLSLPAASRNVEGLLRRGYLERREDDHDRRIKRVCITDAGREVAEQLYVERFIGLEEFAATLSERERRRLASALAPLIEREEIAACHPSPTRT